MLPQSIRKSRAFASAHLLASGWPAEVIERDLDGALAWANSHCMTQQQEKARRTRAQNKTLVKGADALDMMFAAAGIDPVSIPRKREEVQ
jgi:hypothetical protein